jgi:gluconate 2-dehydrogenase gamma chain
MDKLSRRALFRNAGVVGAAALTPALLRSTEAAEAPDANLAQAAAPRAPSAPKTTYVFFNAQEAAFIEAAVARLIPADEHMGGALEAGVPNYIDKQLASAWGGGERLYRSGPWQTGTPVQGYQLPFTPAALFRTAIGAINKDLAAKRTPFARMSPQDQDSFLKTLETGNADLNGVPAQVFFADLWEATLEGFFGDPVYGGNRDMISWRMIGFPGAYASYYELVDQHGIAINRAPVSLAQDEAGHIHPNPNIAPKVP